MLLLFFLTKKQNKEMIMQDKREKADSLLEFTFEKKKQLSTCVNAELKSSGHVCTPNL